MIMALICFSPHARCVSSAVSVENFFQIFEFFFLLRYYGFWVIGSENSVEYVLFPLE